MNSLSRSINRTARMAKLHREAVLAPYGLNGNQHSYILYVCRQPGISQEKLARKIVVNKSNVTRQVAMLEQNGFVRREQSAQDRRQMLVYPTEKAEAALPAVRRMLQEWDEILLEGFSQEERAQAVAMMGRIMRNATLVVEKEWTPEEEE